MIYGYSMAFVQKMDEAWGSAKSICSEIRG
jgi:hypothetical protein